MEFRPMAIEDYDEVFALWQASSPETICDSDSRECVAALLARNPGLSQVARSSDGKLVGALLAGHDGRHATLYHLDVFREERKQHVARQMVSTFFAQLHTTHVEAIYCLVDLEDQLSQYVLRLFGWQTYDLEEDNFMIMRK